MMVSSVYIPYSAIGIVLRTNCTGKWKAYIETNRQARYLKYKNSQKYAGDTGVQGWVKTSLYAKFSRFLNEIGKSEVIEKMCVLIYISCIFILEKNNSNYQ